VELRKKEPHPEMDYARKDPTFLKATGNSEQVGLMIRLTRPSGWWMERFKEVPKR